MTSFVFKEHCPCCGDLKEVNPIAYTTEFWINLFKKREGSVVEIYNSEKLAMFIYHCAKKVDEKVIIETIENGLILKLTFTGENK
jgi:hypothetical protein